MLELILVDTRWTQNKSNILEYAGFENLTTVVDRLWIVIFWGFASGSGLWFESLDPDYDFLIYSPQHWVLGVQEKQKNLSRGERVYSSIIFHCYNLIFVWSVEPCNTRVLDLEFCLHNQDSLFWRSYIIYLKTGMRIRMHYFFHWIRIRIIPVTTDL